MQSALWPAVWSVLLATRSIVAVACTASLISACTLTNGRRYLAGPEIEGLLIGNGSVVRRPLAAAPGEPSADRWKETFLPGLGKEKEGRILGRGRFDSPWTGTWSMDGDSMCVDYEAEGKSCYRLVREGGDRVLWFDGAGALAFESWVESDGLDAAAVEPQSLPVPRETVSFRHGGNTLVGDLALPTGAAPRPAVVFVQGAGPSSRHGSSPIWDEALRRGFATFVWSKPGVDESTGDWREQSMDDRAGEVAAAMDYLAARADVDPERIGLYGASQAGWVLPKVAARREVAFMVLQSCPVDDGMSQELYMVKNVLDLLGVPEGERAQILDLQRRYFALIRESRTYEEFSSGREALLAEAKQHPWYAKLERPPTAAEAWFLAPEAGVVSGPVAFRALDPKMFEFGRRAFVDAVPPRLQDLRSPLLVLYGTRDIIVDWRLGSSAYERLSEVTGNDDVTVVLFESADHTLLQPDSDGYLDFAPGFLTTLGEWLSAHRTD